MIGSDVPGRQTPPRTCYRSGPKAGFGVPVPHFRNARADAFAGTASAGGALLFFVLVILLILSPRTASVEGSSRENEKDYDYENESAGERGIAFVGGVRRPPCTRHSRSLRPVLWPEPEDELEHRAQVIAGEVVAAARLHKLLAPVGALGGSDYK